MALFLEFLAQEWILTLALLVVIVMLVLHEARKSGPSVSPQQAIGLINSEHGVFLDLRDAADFKQGHIVEALHIPATKLQARIAELEKYRDRPIVLVCKMGQQSGAAVPPPWAPACGGSRPVTGVCSSPTWGLPPV